MLASSARQTNELRYLLIIQTDNHFKKASPWRDALKSLESGVGSKEHRNLVKINNDGNITVKKLSDCPIIQKMVLDKETDERYNETVRSSGKGAGS